MSHSKATLTAFVACIALSSCMTLGSAEQANPGAITATTSDQGPAAHAAAEASSAASKNLTELTWYGHAAVVIRTPAGTQLAIDPWFDNPKAPRDHQPPGHFDAILVTHGHFDHLGGARALARKSAAPVIDSFELVSMLGLPESQSWGTNPGGTLKVGSDVEVHVVEAVHSSSVAASGGGAQYAGAAVGYVIVIKDGPTLYHAGDTDVFESMQRIASRYHPHLGMLPIGGHFTMDPEGAALAAQMLNLTTVVPIHYATFPLLTGTPAQLRQSLPASISVLVPTPGLPQRILASGLTAQTL